MKNNKNRFLLILFGIVYSFCCFVISKNNGWGIFGYKSFEFQLIKTAVIFIIVYAVTLINKPNADKIVKYVGYFTLFVAMVFFVDNYFIKFSGSPSFYRLWWLSIIHIVNTAFYLGIFSMKNIDFDRYFKEFFKGYTPLYLVSFVIVFLRPMGNSATTNFIIGNGTFQFFPYLMEHPNDSEIWFNVVGNIVFFIPIAFILKAFIPRIKNYQQLLTGLAVPILIEGYQLVLKCGDVDIDDIVLNFSGFLIGFILLILQTKLKKQNDG